MGLIDAWLTADETAPRKQRRARQADPRPPGGRARLCRQRADSAPLRPRVETPPYPGRGLLPAAGVRAGSRGPCDWGEAVVEIAGVAQTAALFCLRLCYSLKPFVCAFPTARQECFLAGHLAAFTALGGVPHRITYDNLGSAVTKILQGRAPPGA